MRETTQTTLRATQHPVLFEPDILTGYKFSTVFRPKAHFEPEERLMFAVLSDAVECFQKYIGAKSGRCRALFVEAETWFRSKESGWLFSFEHICQVLNISPSYVRLGLVRWRLAHEGKSGPRRRIREPLRYQYRKQRPRNTIVTHRRASNADAQYAT